MRPKRYFPFAEGPRNCVGQNLAKVSLLGTMATLMQHFTFRLAEEVSTPTLFLTGGYISSYWLLNVDLRVS